MYVLGTPFQGYVFVVLNSSTAVVPHILLDDDLACCNVVSNSSSSSRLRKNKRFGKQFAIVKYYCCSYFLQRIFSGKDINVYDDRRL